MIKSSRTKNIAKSTNVIGAYLREKREAVGLRQLDLANAADVAVSTVSRIESGAILPKVDALTRIAEALDLDLSELLGLLGSRTDRELPEFEEYLRAKYKLSEEAIEQVASYFRRIAQPEQGDSELAVSE